MGVNYGAVLRSAVFVHVVHVFHFVLAVGIIQSTKVELIPNRIGYSKTTGILDG